MKKTTTTIILYFTLLSLAFPCITKTIIVDNDGPADFNNIQDAINDANDGDTVLVRDGTYTGTGNRDIDFLGKAISLVSAEGAMSTTIDCEQVTRAFYFHNRYIHLPNL